MAGLFGFVKNNKNFKIEDMAKPLMYSDRVMQGDNYEDDEFAISEVKLKFSRNQYKNDKRFVVFVFGEIYNKNMLEAYFELKANSFEELLVLALYKNIFKKVLNKVDGSFSAIIYDKVAAKVYLVSDRRGTCFLYYYLRDNNFAFASEVKCLLSMGGGGQILDISINENAFEMFMELGYFTEDRTWFKHIKLLKPSSILEFDIKNKTSKQEYYWKYGEIKQQDISFDEAIEKMSKLLFEAVKKRYRENVVVPVSGGLDSRMIVASLYKIDPNLKLHLMTVGQEESSDVKIARKIADFIHQEHKVYYFDSNDDVVENRAKFAWLCDGMFSIQHSHGLGYSNNKDFVENEAKYLFSGVVGGEMFGSGFSNHTRNKNVLESIKSFFAKQTESIDIENSYYQGMPHLHPFILDNLNRRFSYSAYTYQRSYINIILPFLDNELMDFLFSLPDEYREKQMYYKSLLKAFPDFYTKIPIESNSEPKGKDKPLKKWKKKLLHLWNKAFGIYERKGVLYDYGAYIQKPKTRQKIYKILESDIEIPLQKEILGYLRRYNWEENPKKMSKNADILLKLVTIKLYFVAVYYGEQKALEMAKIS